MCSASSPPPPLQHSLDCFLALTHPLIDRFSLDHLFYFSPLDVEYPRRFTPHNHIHSLSSFHHVLQVGGTVFSLWLSLLPTRGWSVWSIWSTRPCGAGENGSRGIYLRQAYCETRRACTEGDDMAGLGLLQCERILTWRYFAPWDILWPTSVMLETFGDWASSIDHSLLQNIVLNTIYSLQLGELHLSPSFSPLSSLMPRSSQRSGTARQFTRHEHHALRYTTSYG